MDPNKLLKEILIAMDNLKDIVHLTPLERSKTFSELSGNNIFLKLENHQLTGSFKVRGAFNKISNLSKEEVRSGVIASSAGNHAQGVAYSATKLGIKSTIVMPKTSPLVKIMATKDYGANVVLHGTNYDEAYATAIEIQKKRGFTFIHPYEEELVIAGQGTIALEILEENNLIDVIVVPVGGGGLISGIALAAKYIKPKIKIVGVQASGANAMYLSKKKGKLVDINQVNTIADGIAIKHVSKVTFNLIKEYVDDIVTVDDKEISSSILMLLERAKMLAEPAGIVSLAAVLNNKIKLKGKNIACVISGGNIDIKTLDGIIKAGLIEHGRVFEFKTILSDKPGELLKLIQIIAENNGNIIGIDHDRALQKIFGFVDVRLSVETRNKEHIKKLLKEIKDSGYRVEEVEY